MKKTERITSVILFLFAVALMVGSRQLVYTAEFGRPGAGFFPFWLGVFITILSTLLFYQSRPSAGEKDQPSPFSSLNRFKKPLTIVASLFATAFLLKPLGFLVAIALWIAFLLVLVERYNWIAGLVTSALGSLGFYLVFEVWLGVPLPIGMFGI